MRAKIHLETALRKVLADRGWEWPDKGVIEPPKDRQFGDMSVNVAMMLAKQAGKPPRAIAEEIAAAMADDPRIARVDIAGPGFLNFTFAPGFWHETIGVVREAGQGYGASDLGKGVRVQVEYVSANPTGPLHIGHGRGAALGDSLVRIMEKAGYEVEAEYYVNDAGRQMRILGSSIWYRLKALSGRDVAEPEDYYRGDYIIGIARDVLAANPGILDMDEKDAVEICQDRGMNDILDGIREDLRAFGVRHDVWFSEKSLVADGLVDETFADLRESGLGFEQDGAFWFRSTQFGDDKDRVLRKSSGDTTYFASDIAYHDHKFKRGFDLVVDIWGADHHGYVPRMMAACEALGKKGGLHVILVNLVNLLRDGEPVAMSTRAGEFETLKDVVDEVGADAARFMFLSRKSDSRLDFDLELVKQKTMDNPVFYVQYAHARICSLNAKAAEAGVAPAGPDKAALALLDTEYDLDVLRLLDQYPDYVESAARTQSPHLISTYLQELASTLHRYYTNCHVLSADPAVASARLMLLGCVAGVVRDGLGLLGVSAPESM
ncbi:MAG: arginine--tRNA ligase [Pseudodesulfovibrio sp.]|uniref:Arginine--tRNA ligase n=1 Tax=Pseudodesulfovibrio aespoeensis (strain ATCC 700646 / DSM 10631 / Aspo-2) TaxID=643562 RepID=E6VVV2_PSEA9|nr:MULTISPECIES: arginine--tRNA ligase [Pseudodesulfovibrio]MBU4192937.1 arginine--tRNA ligase [Pseudomonadota bacterium]ADU61304.1 arginyl-tRNA synthetase [Pseudodesulfovibrio aespoeensis Aspo-2]MBU4243914.1 arginine--tRNA ligase [Pseudomonadota bacterium]MBU4378997.1 arginine--tRNA ligase [Pseudomonadota bacterium]MBU4476752.1 arginine--tRNA ligase [Pseudomonadota bacterium]